MKRIINKHKAEGLINITLSVKLFCSPIKFEAFSTCCLVCDQNLPTVISEWQVIISFSWAKTLSKHDYNRVDFLWLTLKNLIFKLCYGEAISLLHSFTESLPVRHLKPQVVGLPCDKVGDVRQKIWILLLKETNVYGSCLSLIRPMKIPLKTEEVWLLASTQDKKRQQRETKKSLILVGKN